jgi:hypothetical protein
MMMMVVNPIPRPEKPVEEGPLRKVKDYWAFQQRRP